MEKEIIITPEAEEQIITIEKEQGVFPQGTINITSNGTADVSAYATAEVNVAFNTQNKEVEYTQNGINTITADEGYNALNEVQVEVNVPSYLETEINSYGGSSSSLLNIFTEQPTLHIGDNVTTLASFFSNWRMNYIPKLTGMNNVTSMREMFYNAYGETADLHDFTGEKINDVGYMFSSAKVQNIDMHSFNTNKIMNIGDMFYNCQAKHIDLSSLTGETTSRIFAIGNTFRNCYYLETLDISSMDAANLAGGARYGFLNCGTRTTSGLTTVYVKDKAMQDYILNLAGEDRPASWTTANVVIKS